MMFHQNKGQIPVMTAIIGAIATIFVGGITAWATASNTANERIAEVRTSVRVVEERENNHYGELKGSIDEMKEILRAAPWAQNKTTLK